MKIFFDTEFTGLHKNTTLISIGLIAENGDKFYAEFNDYDREQLNLWIIDNVIKNLNFTGLDNDFNTPDWFYWGSKIFIREKLLKWLSKFDEIEWISDVCHYDFVLLIDLLYDNALNIPKNFCAACHDINQDIAEHYWVSEIEAFNISREEILRESGKEIEGKQHNALYDAEIIKSIYEFIQE